MFATGPRRRKGLEFVCVFGHDERVKSLWPDAPERAGSVSRGRAANQFENGESDGATATPRPASCNLNSFTERWVKSVKEECLSKLILFGEKSLRHALREYVVYHHTREESSRQGESAAVPGQRPVA